MKILPEIGLGCGLYWRFFGRGPIEATNRQESISCATSIFLLSPSSKSFLFSLFFLAASSSSEQAIAHSLLKFT
jgi:hypothetical protein